MRQHHELYRSRIRPRKPADLLALTGLFGVILASLLVFDLRPAPSSPVSEAETFSPEAQDMLQWVHQTRMREDDWR